MTVITWKCELRVYPVLGVCALDVLESCIADVVLTPVVRARDVCRLTSKLCPNSDVHHYEAEQ